MKTRLSACRTAALIVVSLLLCAGRGYADDIRVMTSGAFTAALIEMRYPTFVAGSLAYDSLGRIDVDGVGVPIECAGVTVHPGDLVIGDDDGVAIVPRAVAEEVVELAEAKVSGENVVRDRLAEGMPVAEAFRTYGIL